MNVSVSSNTLVPKDQPTSRILVIGFNFTNYSAAEDQLSGDEISSGDRGGAPFSSLAFLLYLIYLFPLPFFFFRPFFFVAFSFWDFWGFFPLLKDLKRIFCCLTVSLSVNHRLLLFLKRQRSATSQSTRRNLGRGNNYFETATLPHVASLS